MPLPTAACTARLVAGIADTQCGFKVFRGTLARQVFADTRTAGFSFDVEVLGRAQLLGAASRSSPSSGSTFRARPSSPARHGVQSFAQLAGIALMLRRAQRQAATVEPRHAAVATARATRVGRPRAGCLSHAPSTASGRSVVNWRDLDHCLAGGSEHYAWEYARALQRGGGTRRVPHRP